MIFCISLFLILQNFIIGKSTITINDCDILIAGGSLSSLAAAITAGNITISNNHNSTIVCLTEPTDWLGGQLTSSNVPPDFGQYNKIIENLPQSFVSLLNQITNYTGNSDWNYNPGMCWVSIKCFQGSDAATTILSWINSDYSVNLRIYFNTVISKAVVSNRNIKDVFAIQRMNNSIDWEFNLSEELPDWYSARDSALYNKTVLHFINFKVIIEGTEFGDILMTSGISVAQGYEYPTESSDTLNTACGQAAVLPFYVGYSDESEIVSNNQVPDGSQGTVPFLISEDLTWEQIWTYRRAVAVNVSQYDDTMSNPTVAIGEQSNINLDNDYTEGYIFSSFTELDKANLLKTGEWDGGINLTTLSGLEQRAYAYYHFLAQQSPSTDSMVLPMKAFLTLNKTQTGTIHGLAKLPYLRDSRRSGQGIEGFKLMYADISQSNTNSNNEETAKRFHDTVGIGNYYYADIHKLEAFACPLDVHGSSADGASSNQLDDSYGSDQGLASEKQGGGYPPYLEGENKEVLPYYIPFRALTNIDADNLLVTGKSMAQSFLANAGTRLHPSEWSSGVAAGAAAVLLVQHWDDGWRGTTDVYNNIGCLQSLLTSDSVKSPLEWTF